MQKINERLKNSEERYRCFGTNEASRGWIRWLKELVILRAITMWNMAQMARVYIFKAHHVLTRIMEFETEWRLVIFQCLPKNRDLAIW